MNYEDPPSPRAVVRVILGSAAGLAAVFLVIAFVASQDDAAKADALITRLASRYPDAPELNYVRPR